MIDMMQNILKSGELYAEFMNAVMEAVSSDADQRSEALDRLCDKMIRQTLSLYEEGFGRFLKMPQLGISRESLQEAMAAADAWNRFMLAMGEFAIKFNLPLTDAFETLMAQIRERSGTDTDFKSAQEIYHAAVDILDKKYDAHIKSEEGVQTVVDVVQKYLAFRKKADRANDIWLKSLSIPTSKEMTDVYRSIYELKRKTRQQAQIIQNHDRLIDHLKRKLQLLETSLGKVAE